jgi:hypothetical protein
VKETRQTDHHDHGYQKERRKDVNEGAEDLKMTIMKYDDQYRHMITARNRS